MLRTLFPLMACAIPLQLSAQPEVGDIRLIVQLTIDGMRGDLLTRYRPSFGSDGFNRLLENGVWYTNAHHFHANTETIVGHATLATGAHPVGTLMVVRLKSDLWQGRNKPIPLAKKRLNVLATLLTFLEKHCDSPQLREGL